MREQREEGGRGITHLQRKSESRRERKIILDERANYILIISNCALYPTIISSDRCTRKRVFIRHYVHSFLPRKKF